MIHRRSQNELAPRPLKIVDAREAIDDYDKWQALYKRIIVDRSQN